MVNATLEIAEKKIQFSGLEALKQELEKQSLNPERLTEFQKTINEALQESDKDGIIEFTEKEWQQLITNENLPPIEEVKRLLTSKIKAMKEVTAETKEKTEGIAEEITAKVEEVKKWVTAKVDETKEKITAGITEALSPIQKIKESFTAMGTKIGDFFSEIGTTLKFLFFTLGAALGLKSAKDALANMAKEKAEKVIAEWKEKAGEKVAEVKEWLTEKTAPLGILATAGLWIFKLIKDRLPPSLAEKLWGADGKGLLKKLAANRALKLFGIGWIWLFWIGKLYEYIENNGASLGEMPTDEAGKKSWWEKAMAGANVASQDILDIVTGKKIAEKMQEENKVGYVTLENHPMVTGAKNELQNFEKDLEILYHGNEPAFKGLAVFAFLWKWGTIASMWAKGATFLMTLLKASAGNAISHPLMMGIGLILATNGVSALKNIEIKEDLTSDEIAEKLWDMMNLEEYRTYFEEHFPDTMKNEYIDEAADKLVNGGEVLKQEIQHFKENWKTDLPKGLFDILIQTNTEKIQGTNQNGLETFQAEIEKIALNNTEKNYDALIGKNGQGMIPTILDKLKQKKSLTEGDIHALMSATRNTDIIIFPEWGNKTGATIRWARIGQDGIEGFGKNICVNPTLEINEQVTIARDFVIDSFNPSSLTVLGKWAEWIRDITSSIVASLHNDPEKARNGLEEIMVKKCGILWYGSYAYVVDYLGNKYALGPLNLIEWIMAWMRWDDYGVQEALVDYGQWMAPVFVFWLLKSGIHNVVSLSRGNGWRGLWLGKVLTETLTYPVTIPKNIGTFICQKLRAGHSIGEIINPHIILRDEFYKKLWNMSINTQKMRDMGTKIEEKEKYEKMKRKIEKLKKKNNWFINNKKQVKEVLDEAWKLFNKKFKNLDDALTHIDTEINTLNKALSYLKDGIRQNFPPELMNRTAEVESLKGFDISTEQGRKDAEKMFADAQWEIETMEKERMRVEAEHTDAKKKFEANPSDTGLKQDFDTKQKAHLDMMNTYHEQHRDLSEIREAMGELLHGRKPKIRIWESHIRSVKWLRGSAKILGIIAVTVWAWVAIEKIANAVHGDSSEIDKWDEVSENDDRYYGFKKDAKETNIEKKEGNEYTCETPEEFNERIEAIETQYTEAINKFMDPEFVNAVSSDEREKNIQEAADGHMLRVDMMKSLIKANKEMMEAHWNKHFTNEETGEEVVPNDIREQGVKAFMFIHKKDGELTLDYMNHQDMKNVFYILYDGARTSFLEDWLGEKWAMATDLGLRVAPFTGSFMDGKDAYQHFSRGNTMDGVWSTAWCIGGLALDIGWFFSFGWTAAAGTALRTTKAGVKIAKTAWGALLHNGVQLGVQFGTSLAKVPRSESISINDL